MGYLVEAREIGFSATWKEEEKVLRPFRTVAQQPKPREVFDGVAPMGSLQLQMVIFRMMPQGARCSLCVVRSLPGCGCV